MKYQTENFSGDYVFRSNFHNGWMIESHLHEYSELLYCKQGRGDIYVNGKHMTIEEDQLVWIPPNYIHRYDCADAQLVCAVFTNDFVPLFFRATEGKRLAVTPVDSGELAAVLADFHHLKDEDRCLVCGYLNLICAKVLEQSELESVWQTDGILYQKVISYISAHYSEDISLKQLARKFGYNEKYLSHSLHELTGIHFSQLLSLYRVDYAKKLLISRKDGNISRIALDCGFSAVNTFNRVFKEMTGVTPSQYRKKYGR